MLPNVSFVLTSCGRPDLLNQTLISFFKFNDYKLKDLFLVEDSFDENMYEKIKNRWGKHLKVICNKQKKGQIKSIVDTYKLIDTPYIFHCEDDWIYTRKNFIKESLKILETDEKIIQVWLESKKSASRLDIFTYGEVKKIGKIKFRKVFCKEGWEWGHFSFRPGVKRLKDYKLINGYNNYTNELDISVKYKQLGYYTVIMENPAVIDIGDDFHKGDPTRKWPKRRKTNAPTGLRRLWKHIKTLRF